MHKAIQRLALLAAVPLSMAGLAAFTAPAATAAPAATRPLVKGIHLNVKPFTAHRQVAITRPATANTPRPAAGNMTSHGGPTQGDPQVAVIFWGLWWSSTCANQQGNGGGDEGYLGALYNGLGSSSENESPIDSQYYGPVGSYPIFPTVAGKVLVGFNVYCDGAVPQSATQSQIAAVAVAYGNFLQSNGVPVSNNTQIVVVSPSGTNPGGGFGSQYCAWHSWTTFSGSQELSYTNLPYMPDAGGNCGAFFVQNGDDGWSIVGGHEYNESVTDPFGTGWYDSSGFSGEIGDKCAWTNLFVQNTATYSDAMQPEYDNRTSGCRSASTYPHGNLKLASDPTKCLTSTLTLGSTVKLFQPCDTTSGRTFARYTDGSLRRWRNTGVCVTPQGGSNVSGTVLVAARCTGASYQRWSYNATTQRWTNGNGLCMKSSTTANGAAIRESTCSASVATERFSNI